MLTPCRLLNNKLSQQRLATIIGEAVEIERSFLCDALPVDLIGMNAKLMEQYIQFVADRLMVALDADKLYNASNPFDWMELLSLQYASLAFCGTAFVFSSESNVSTMPASMLFAEP